MRFEELSGNRLKKALEATRTVKSYHNKHVDGSGNFGFVIVFKRSDALKDVGCGMKVADEKWYNLHGNYTTDKTIYGLSFGDYASAGASIPNEWNFRQLIDFAKRFIIQNEHLNEPVKVEIT